MANKKIPMIEDDGEETECECDKELEELAISKTLVGDTYLTKMIYSAMRTIKENQYEKSCKKIKPVILQVEKYINSLSTTKNLTVFEAMLLIDGIYRTALLSYYKKFGKTFIKADIIAGYG